VTVIVHQYQTFITQKMMRKHTFQQANLENFNKWEIYYLVSIQNCIMAIKVLDHFMFLRMTAIQTSLLADILQKKVILMIKLDIENTDGFEGEWNSFNIVDVEIKGQSATYSLETTVMVEMKMTK